MIDYMLLIKDAAVIQERRLFKSGGYSRAALISKG